METKNLTKELYEKAVSLGVHEIGLHFSGGNDEGYLDVSMSPSYDSDFSQKIEDWAWSVYDYNGAGDGSDYGDNIIYNLVNKTVISESWHTEKVIGGYQSDELEIE